MRREILAVLIVLVIVHSALGEDAPTARTKQTIFIFHSDEFWLNLHHFLYVLGRAENQTQDSSRSAVVNAPKDEEQGLAKLTEAERATWREAVSFYAKDLSKKDAIFDEPLPPITNALAQAGDAKSLEKANGGPAIASALERAAPIYRKSWWPAHHAANVKWQRLI